MSIATGILRKADTFLKRQLKAELKAQGHFLTGGLERSMLGVIAEVGSVAALEGTAANYGGILDAGIKPSRVPFGGGSRSGGGGGTSKYIQGLVTFWKLKGLNDKQALSAAFATAKKQKLEGMPTEGSYKFSKNGSRRYFIAKVKDKVTPQLKKLITGELNNAFFKEVRKTKSERI